MFRIILFIICLFSFEMALAQESKSNASDEVLSPALLLNLSYAIEAPAGDLKYRFGTDFSIGLGFQYLSSKQYFAGLEMNYFFGSRVKEDVLDILKNSSGAIIGINNQFASVTLGERGVEFGALVGKIFPVVERNPRSGIKASVGVNFIQHWIRIQDNAGSVPQLAGENRKGYDRLTNGIALTEFIGYQHFSRNGLVAFYLGFEFTQGFTKSRRDWNTDLMNVDTEPRVDLLQAFRLGWTLPLFLDKKPDDIFY